MILSSMTQILEKVALRTLKLTLRTYQWISRRKTLRKRLTEQDQFNELLLNKMTRMEVGMAALTKIALDIQAPPTTDASKKADPKDPGTLGVPKDKGKGIIVEELNKNPSNKQPKKSKSYWTTSTEEERKPRLRAR
uniref:Uncharacterized protein n=1 Tax=Cannabis sativa TaxID=3483 RepID=A0A803Q5P6_CANSA